MSNLPASQLLCVLVCSVYDGLPIIVTAPMTYTEAMKAAETIAKLNFIGCRPHRRFGLRDLRARLSWLASAGKQGKLGA